MPTQRHVSVPILYNVAITATLCHDLTNQCICKTVEFNLDLIQEDPRVVSWDLSLDLYMCLRHCELQTGIMTGLPRLRQKPQYLA